MTIQGKTLSLTRNELKAQNPAGHAPVVISGVLKANNGIYPVGMIVKRDVDGLTLIPLVTGDASPVGVMDSTVDTSLEGSGNYVAHGSVQSAVICLGVGSAAPAQGDLINLQTHGIFPS